MENSNVPNTYSRRTLIGGWFEDQMLYEHKLNEYLERKARNASQLQATSDASTASAGAVLPGGAVKLSYHKDNKVYIGDALLIASVGTNGLLTYDEFSQDFVTTTSNKGPIALNTFLIEPASSSQSSGANLRYGETFRLRLHPQATSSPSSSSSSTSSSDPVYLASVPVSLMTSLKHKRQQLITSTDASSDTLWAIAPRSVDERLEKEGSPVMAEADVVIRHVVTGQCLFSDASGSHGHETRWGVEVYAARCAGRQQGLFHEMIGESVPDVPRFGEGPANGWTLLLASKP